MGDELSITATISPTITTVAIPIAESRIGIQFTWPLPL
jgi:hypothetical protein